MRFTGTHQPRRYLGGISALFLGFPLYIQSSQLITVPAKRQTTPTAAEISRDARAGKPSQRPVPDPKLTESGRVKENDPDRLTPLHPAAAGAAAGGHPSSSIVRFPRENNTQISEESNQGRTTLWSATRLKDGDKTDSIADILYRKDANANSASETPVEGQSYTERNGGALLNDRNKDYNIVDTSLRKDANANSASETSMPNSTTPLVNAVQAGLDMRMLGLLFSKSPPPDIPPKANSAAVDVKFRENERNMEVLKEQDRALSPTAPKTDIVGPLNTLLARIAQTINDFTGGDVLAPPRLLESTGSSSGSSGDFARSPKVSSLSHIAGYRVLTWAWPSQAEALATQEFDPVRFDKEITGKITGVGLDRYPVGGEPPQTAGHKAAVLAEPGATALASPENLPELGANSSQSEVFRLLGLAGGSTNSGDFSRSPESSQSKVFAAQQPDPLRFDGEIAAHTATVGPGKSPAESKFPKATAREAAALAEPGTTAPASPEQSSGLGARPSQSEVPAAQQFDPVEFYKEITEHITKLGLDKFLPAGSEFLQEVARKAGILSESRTTALTGPEQFPGLGARPSQSEALHPMGLAGGSSNSEDLSRAPKSKVDATKQFDLVDFDEGITGKPTRGELRKLPADGEFLQAVALKAATLAEPGTTVLASPENLPGLGAHYSQSEVLRLLALADRSSDSEDFPKSPKSEAHAAQKFDKGVTGHTTWVGLSMSPMDSESLQTEARKPVALVESDTTASASPGHSPGLGAHSSQSEVLRQLKLAGSSNDSGDSPRHPKSEVLAAQQFDPMELDKGITGHTTWVGLSMSPVDIESLQTARKTTTLAESDTTALASPEHLSRSRADSPQPEAPAAQQFDPLRFCKEIAENITRVGLDKLPLGGGEYLQAMARRAGILVESRATALASPDHLPGLGAHSSQSDALRPGSSSDTSGNFTKPLKPEAHAAQQSDPVELDKGITGYTTWVGLSMSPVDSEFLQTETHKAAILAESSTPALAGPEHSPVSGGHSSQSEVLHLMGNTGNSNDSPGGFVSLPKPKVFAAQQYDQAEFDKDATGDNTSVGPSKLPADGEFLQTVPRKAGALAESGTTALTCPERPSQLGAHSSQPGVFRLLRFAGSSDYPSGDTARAPKSKVFVAQQSDPLTSDKEVTEPIARVGGSGKSPVDDEFLQAVVRETALAESGTPALASPENLPGLGVCSSQSEAPAVQQLDSVKSGKEIPRHITSVGLPELLADIESLQTVVHEAATLAKSRGIALASPKHSPKLEVHSPQLKVPAAQQLDPVKLDKDITGHTISEGLSELLSVESEFQTVAGKTAELGTTALTSPKHFPGLGAHPSQSEVLAAPQLDPVKSGKGITGHTTSEGLGEFISADNKFLQTAVRKATTLAELGATALASPMHSPELEVHSSQPEVSAAQRPDPVKFGKEITGPISEGLSECSPPESELLRTVAGKTAEPETTTLTSPQHFPGLETHPSQPEVPAAQRSDPAELDKEITEHTTSEGPGKLIPADNEFLQTAVHKAATSAELETTALVSPMSMYSPGLEAHPPQPKVSAAQQLDPVKFGKEITGHATSEGPGEFFPAGSEFHQTVVGKAAESRTTALNSLKHFPGLGAHPSQPEVPATQQSDPVELDREIAEHTTSEGLGELFADNKFLQTAVHKAATSAELETTALANPKHSPGLEVHPPQPEVSAAQQLDPVKFGKEITGHTTSEGSGEFFPADSEFQAGKTAGSEATTLTSPEHFPGSGAHPSQSEVPAAQQSDPVELDKEITEHTTSEGLGGLFADNEFLQTAVHKAAASAELETTALANPKHSPRLEAHPPQPEVSAAQQLDPVKFDKEITGHTTSEGPGEFFPAESEFHQTVAGKTVGSETTTLTSPEHFPGLGAHLSQSEILAVQQLDPVKSGKGITGHTTREGLGEFIPAGNEFLQTAGHKTTTLAESGATSLDSPEHLPGLGAHPSQYEVPAVKQLDSVIFDKAIARHIASVGPSGFFHSESEFYQTGAHKATEPGTTTLASPEYLPGHPSQSEVPAAKQLDPVKSDKGITGHITTVGLGELFPAVSEFHQTVARKAAESGTTTLASPEHLPELGTQSPQSEVLAAKQLHPVELDKGITGHITNVGLGEFSPTDNEFLQTVAQKATTMAELGATAPTSPGYPPGLGEYSSQSKVFAVQQPDPLIFDKEVAGHIARVGELRKSPADHQFLQTAAGKETILAESAATPLATTALTSPKHFPGHSSQSEVPAAHYLDPVKFDKKIIEHVTSAGLPKLPANSEVLQAVARKAATSVESAATALASPGDFPELGAHYSHSEVPVAQRLNPVIFGKEIPRHITSLGPSKSTADGEFPQTMACKATILAESRTTALACPEHSPGLAVHSSQPEAPVAQQLDPVKLDKGITKHITSVGPSEFSPVESELLQTVADQAAESEITILANPEHLPRLEVHLSQPEVPAAQQLDPVIFDNEITRNIAGEGLGERFPADKAAESGTTALASLEHLPGLEAHSSQPEVPVAQQLDTVVFDNEITENITSEGLGEFFPADNGFLQRVAHEAATLAESGIAALANPEHLPGLEVHFLQPEVPAAQQLDPAIFDNEISGNITGEGLGERFPTDKAAESGTTTLTSPEHFLGLKVHPSQSELPAAQQLYPVELDKGITGHITNVGLGEPLLTDNKPLQTVAHMATTLAEPGAAALASPGDLLRLEVHPSQSELLGAQKLDPVEFDKEFAGHITNVGLSGFYPVESGFQRTVARKAVESGTTTLPSPGHLPRYPSHSEVPEAQQLDPVKFDKEITRHTTSVRTSEFPADGEYLQTMPRTATTLAEPETTALASPEHSPGLGAHPSQHEVLARQQLDPVEFDKEITGHITSARLSELPPVESEFLQAVASKAAESEATTLDSPEHIPGYPSQSEVPAAKQLDPVNFDKETARNIAIVGLSEFPADDEYLQTSPLRAATLAEPGTATFASPEQLPGLGAHFPHPEMPRLPRPASNSNDSSGDFPSLQKSKVLAAKQFGPVKSGKETTRHTTRVGLPRFPADSKFLQTVARKATTLTGPRATALASPDNSLGLKMRSSRPEVPGAEQFDPIKSDEGITRHIRRAGLSKSPADNEFPQTATHKAAESGTTTLTNPKHFPGLGAHSSQPEVPAAQQLDPEITGNITSDGLGEFTPAGGEFLQTVAGKAAESGTTTFASPERLARLEAHSSRPEAPTAQQLDPVRFDKETTSHITSERPSKFPIDSGYLQTMPREATTLTAPGATALASAEHLPGLEVHSSQPEVPAAQQLDPAELDKKSTGHITSAGLGEFFPAENEFHPTVARKAAESGTTTLGSTEHLPGDPLSGFSPKESEFLQTAVGKAAESGTITLASPEHFPGLEVRSSQTEAPVAQQLDPVELDSEITAHITGAGLGKFPADGEYPQALPRKAMTLAEPGTTAFVSPEYFPGLGAHTSQPEEPRQLRIGGSSDDSSGDFSNPQKSKVLAAKQFGPVKSDKETTKHTTRVGLPRFPADRKFLQVVARMAATLAEPGATALASPENPLELEMHSSQSEVPVTQQFDPIKSDEGIARHIRRVGLSKFPAGCEFLQAVGRKAAESGTTALASPEHLPGLEAHSSQTEAPATQQLDPLNFDQDITGTITNEGLGDSFPADNELPQIVAHEATTLAESGTAALASPEHFPGLEVHFSQPEVPAAQQLDPVIFDNEITGNITDKAAESGTTALTSLGNLPGLEAHSSQSEVPVAQQLDPEITEITSEELSECFPADNGFPQTVVKEAAESGTTALASPEQLPELEAHSSQAEVHAAQQLDPVEPDSEITRHITNAGPSDNFPAGSELPQIVAHEATTLAESGTAAVASPENLPALEAHSSQPEAAAAQQLDPEITGNIASNGLGESSPVEGEFLQAVAGKAAESETTTVASPEHFAGLEAHSSQPEAPVAQQFDPAKFDNETTGYITSEGLGEFFPAGSEFLQTVARKAAILAESEATALASPEYLPGLTRLSLYQHILFCDNSGSMNTGGRINSMIDVTKGFAEIASILPPDDEGLRIRFLNNTNIERELYERYEKVRTASDAAEMLSQARYYGITLLGTVLKREVLEPYVYHYLDQNQNLERPILISIITDGCPYGEDNDKLKQVIVECKRKLQEKNLNPGVVNFQINQIGNDSQAEAFLEDLRTDSEVKNHIFCPSQKLDDKYKELRNNKDELEVWLYKTLGGPVLQQG